MTRLDITARNAIVSHTLRLKLVKERRMEKSVLKKELAEILLLLLLTSLLYIVKCEGRGESGFCFLFLFFNILNLVSGRKK